MKQAAFGLFFVFFPFAIELVVDMYNLPFGLYAMIACIILGYGLIVTSDPFYKYIWVYKGVKRRIMVVLITGVVTGLLGSLGAYFFTENAKNVTQTAETSSKNPLPTIIQQAPSYGNLKGRAISLSDEIMEDHLHIHGWKRPSGKGLIGNMPTTGEEVTKLTKSRSSYFRFRFYENVLDIRNEFSQLHLRDERLDDFFKYQGMIEDAKKQLSAVGKQMNVPVLPQQIEEVAERLKVLAHHIK